MDQKLMRDCAMRAGLIDNYYFDGSMGIKLNDFAKEIIKEVERAINRTGALENDLGNAGMYVDSVKERFGIK